MDKKKYTFHGIVKLFGETVNSNWFADTYAVSKKKAMSNFKYQYKKQKGLTKDAKVELKGEVKEWK